MQWHQLSQSICVDADIRSTKIFPSLPRRCRKGQIERVYGNEEKRGRRHQVSTQFAKDISTKTPTKTTEKMINFIKDAVTAVSGIKSFLFNTDYRNNFDLQNVEFPCCVLTPIMRTNYDLKNIIRESAELQLSVVDLAPYDYTGDDLYAINKRCSDLALQVIANLQVKSKLDKELTFEFILPSGDELISGVMCNLQCTMKQGSCIGAPSYVEIVVQPVKRENITSNGKHVITPSSGFNAMREVEVDVNVPQLQLEEKQVTITSNGTTIVTPSVADGMSKVQVVTDVINEPILQDKQVTITENGTQTITADEGFEGLNSVEVNVDMLDWLVYAKDCEQLFRDSPIPKLPRVINIPNATNAYLMFLYCKVATENEIIVNTGWKKDLDSTFNMKGFFQSVKLSIDKLEIIGDRYHNIGSINTNANSTIDKLYALNSENCTAFSLISWNTEIRCIYFGSVEKATSFDNFANHYGVEIIQMSRWKQTSLYLHNITALKPFSIHYIIQNAMSVAEGATARTLTLNATVKTNWQNSEYYEQDLAVLTDKGITMA